MIFDTDQPQGTPINNLQDENVEFIPDATVIEVLQQIEQAAIVANEILPPIADVQKKSLDVAQSFAPAKTVLVTGNKAAKKSTSRKRYAITIMFSEEEWNDVVLPNAKEQIKNYGCENVSQFGRWLFDYAINLNSFTPFGTNYLGVPEQYKPKLLKNGFPDFVKANKNLPVCK